MLAKSSMGWQKSVDFESKLGNRKCGSRDTSSNDQEGGRDGLTKGVLTGGLLVREREGVEVAAIGEGSFFKYL